MVFQKDLGNLKSLQIRLHTKNSTVECKSPQKVFEDFFGLSKRPTLKPLQIRLHTKNGSLEGKRPFQSPGRTFAAF